MNAPSFPKLPSDRTPADYARYYFDFCRLRFEVTFGLYVLTPGERIAGYLIVLSISAILGFTVTCYLPPLCALLFRYTYWMMTVMTRFHVIHRVSFNPDLNWNMTDTLISNQRCAVVLQMVQSTCDQSSPFVF